MKLRNKKTGEVIEVCKVNPEPFEALDFTCNSLAELNEEWEDYEEPEIIWYINLSGVACCATKENYWGDCKEIGNYFGTREEAEKAVEKLKAWKRLKDNGFKFEGWKRDEKYWGDFTITATDQISCDDKDLDLLFGGEE